MAESNEADQYLLEQVRRGDPEGWRQFVGRFEGRLLAFARGRVPQQSAAEDLVQETFLAFLQSMQRFRMESSLETYLFGILRRKVIDVFRGRALRACSLDELSPGAGDEPGNPPLPGREPTGSWYARRDERDEHLAEALGTGLASLLGRLRNSGQFKDLQIVEACFYAQLRNRDVAGLLRLDEKHVALVKHRCLRELRDHVLETGTDLEQWQDSERSTAMLTEVWESQRLTCPKRSTLGRYLLRTLDPPWQQYVGFHVERLGCRFCRANLEDMRQADPHESTRSAAQLFQSTIGFLHGLPH